MESKIIQCLEFDVLTTSSLNFFNCLNQITELKGKNYFLGLYLLEICLFDVRFRKYSPKVIACSIIFFIKKLRKHQICWNDELKHLFHADEAELRRCARDICNFWQRVPELEIMSSLKAKFSTGMYMEVGKIRIA